MSFVYKSEQFHSIRNNNKNLIKNNIVSIRNGTGTKTTKIIENNTVIKNIVSPLKASEIKKIKNNIFIPNLFVHAVKNNKTKTTKTTKTKKTQRSKRFRTRKQRN